MKKNIVQDVIPPKKSIRNIDLLYKSKRLEKVPDPKPEEKVIVKEKDLPDTPYEYEYSEPAKHSRKALYVSLGLLVVALAFGISTFFKSATVKITPKNEIVSMSENFKATKDISTNSGLGFQIVTTTKDIERTVEATDQQNVEKKSSGKIVIYNSFSTEPQKLIATTRFETKEGLVFRIKDAVTVPGMQTKSGKVVAGSVEATVEADRPGQEYNIPLKDFTVSAFKGTSKATKIYGRSKTEMIGGFSGMQKTVSNETIEKIDSEMEADLKSLLAKDIVSQMPENFVLYPGGISYTLEPTVQVGNSSGSGASDNNIVLRKKGYINAIIFDKGSLSRIVTARVLPSAVDDNTKISNLDSLVFSLSPNYRTDSSDNSSISFDLKGEAKFVWVFDENKLKNELLGISKKNAMTVIGTYPTIKEALIETHPFWNQTIPKDPENVMMLNTLTK